MSMINDALRRASSASKGAGSAPPALPVTPPAPPPPVRVETSAFPPPPPPVATADSLPPTPVANSAPRKSGKLQLLLALLLVLAVGVAVAINFWANKTEKARLIVSANEGKAVQPKTAAVTAVSSTPALPINPTPPVAAQPVASAPATIPAPATPPPVPVVTAPPKFPSLRLQSIFYRPANPSVMINGKTLFVDDEIQGVHVVDIQPASVTLVLSGHTNILTLR